MQFRQTVFIVGSALMITPCFAQESGSSVHVWTTSPDQPKIVIGQAGTAVGGAVGGGQVFSYGPSTFEFISNEMSFDKTVKGSPYSAEATTEFTQTLADGNRIVRTQTSKFYRDSQGRVRREQQLKSIGQFTNAEPKTIITISDPVAGTSVTLDPNFKTAARAMATLSDKMEVMRSTLSTAGGVMTSSSYSTGVRVGGRAEGMKMEQDDTKTESLGSRMIDTVRADGTRKVTRIPAGKIGNERDIEIVVETWYSPELQTTVESKRTDPMNGVTSFKLTNISRSEPAADLFEIPEEYKTRERPVMLRRTRE